MEKIKVLMADDEEDVLKIMEKKISMAGYDVIAVNDGKQAWEKIQSESPDVVLLDLIMPGMDGFTVLKNLRQNPPSEKWQPVIIISAKNEIGDLQKGLSLEADHYISKPCNMDEILKGIRLMVSLIPQRKTKTEIEDDSKSTNE